MKNVHISRHPLVMDKIARLRDRKTSVVDFRRLMGELSMFLAHDAFLHAKVKSVKKGDIMSLVKFTVTQPHEMASVLTTESVKDLKLKAGDQVELIIKAIHVLPVKE